VVQFSNEIWPSFRLTQTPCTLHMQSRYEEYRSLDTGILPFIYGALSIHIFD